MGKRFASTGDAEGRYIEMARNLGWSEDVVQVIGHDEETEDGIWDEDDEDDSVPSSSRGSGSGGSGSLSVSVSAIAKPVEVVDRSLHGLVLQGDLEGLDALLETEPGLDLDKRDEYVSLLSSRLDWDSLTFRRDMDPFTSLATVDSFKWSNGYWHMEQTSLSRYVSLSLSHPRKRINQKNN